METTAITYWIRYAVDPFHDQAQLIQEFFLPEYKLTFNFAHPLGLGDTHLNVFYTEDVKKTQKPYFHRQPEAITSHKTISIPRSIADHVQHVFELKQKIESLEKDVRQWTNMDSIRLLKE